MGSSSIFTQSVCGRNGEGVTINNKNLNNSEKNIYAVTGYSEEIPNGVSASTTNNKTGVFDLSGCVWERTAAYIANENEHLNIYGSSYTTLKTSTKYATVYPYNASNDSSANNWTAYKNSSYGYGDAILETSTAETSTSEQEQLTNAWENNYSNYPYTHGTFFLFVVVIVATLVKQVYLHLPMQLVIHNKLMDFVLY